MKPKIGTNTNLDKKKKEEEEKIEKYNNKNNSCSNCRQMAFMKGVIWKHGIKALNWMVFLIFWKSLLYSWTDQV